MNSSRRMFAVAYVAVLVLARPLVASADPSRSTSGLDIQSMFNASQTVLVGTVTGIRLLAENGENQPAILRSESTRIQKWEAAVRVLQIYKGAVVPTVSVAFTVQVPATSARYGPSLDQGKTALLFLVPWSDGRYGFTNPEWGKFRLPGFVRSSESGSGPELLENDLDKTWAEDSASAKNVLDVLLTFKNISATTENQAAALSGNQNLQVAAEAFAVLLNTRKNQYYANLLQFLSHNGTAVKGDELVAIFGRVQDPGPNADPRIFDQLSRLPVAPIKLAAMYAIRKINSPESVRTLIGHLDDPDPNIQFLSVITLNGIVRNGSEYGPSNPDFSQKPQAYIALWRQWWETVGKAQYGGED